MSHKAGYGENSTQKAKRSKRMKAALTGAFNLLLKVYAIGFEMGFYEGKKQTTTGSGSGRLSGNKHRPRSTGKARKPTGQK